MIENKSDNTTRKRINLDEPITDMIKRLKSEHRSFETKLHDVEDAINSEDKDIIYAVKIIRSMSESIIHHAVE